MGHVGSSSRGRQDALIDRPNPWLREGRTGSMGVACMSPIEAPPSRHPLNHGDNVGEEGEICKYVFMQICKFVKCVKIYPMYRLKYFILF